MTITEALAAGYRPMLLPGVKVGSSVLMNRRASEPGTSVQVQTPDELQALYERYQIEQPRRKRDVQAQQASTTTNTPVNSDVPVRQTAGKEDSEQQGEVAK